MVSLAGSLRLAQVLGRYNWTLGMEFARRSKRPDPYLARRDVTRVLALSPSVDLARTRSWHEMASIIAGLMQVCPPPPTISSPPLHPARSAAGAHHSVAAP